MTKAQSQRLCDIRENMTVTLANIQWVEDMILKAKNKTDLLDLQKQRRQHLKTYHKLLEEKELLTLPA